MICAISDANKKRFLTLMVVDVLEAARSGQPFFTEKYIKDTYKLILDRTADRAKAQTFASFIPGNLISIFAANEEARKHLTPSIVELATLSDTFKDFDSVGTYLGIGQEAAQTKKQEIVEANESSLRVEEDPTAGASPAVVAGTAKPTNKSSISTNFKAAGKSALTAFNVDSSDPIILASENFIGKYHQAQKSGSAEYQGIRLKVVPARSIIADLPQREREFLENTPSYEGVKAIIVNADNSPVRIDSQGNIAEEGVLAQYMLNRPELVDGVFVKKTETPISEVASALGVDESVAQEARQKEYRILYNIRKALEQDPNREIYVGINTSAGFSVDVQYDNPVSLGDINFKALGEEFIPYVGDGERDTKLGHAYFNLSFSSKPLKIDRPGITEILPAETLAKYIFDESIPLATRTEVFERLLYIGKNIPKIRLREGKILYNGKSVTEDVIVSVLKSVTESARGSVNSTYRASVPLNMSTTVDIPYYDQNGKVQYNTLEAVDYLKKYFTTPARLEETTTPYFNLDITPEEQIAFQADVERLSEQTPAVQPSTPATSAESQLLSNVSAAPTVVESIVSDRKADIETRRQEVRNIFNTNKLLAIHIIENEKRIGSFDEYGKPNGELQDIVSVLKVSVSEAQDLLKQYLDSGKPEGWKLGDEYNFSKYDAELAALESNTQASTSVKPTIDTSREWRGDLESRPVYTQQGVNTMRTSAANAFEHFGNPFSKAGYGGTIKVPSIGAAVIAYKEWLLGTNYKDVKPEQRTWILNQINQGKLDSVTLLYAGKSAARGQGMHPTALAEVVEQLRDTQPSTSVEREYTPENITTLKPNEVFVFGANTAGGHGGGTAGLAQRGTTSSNYTALPVGTKGKWSEYGIVDKLMQGTEGKSFGIVTKAATISGTSLKIGAKRSVPLSRIEESINALIKTASENPSLKFLVTKFGTNMAGFSEQEMKSLLENKNLPDNIILPKEFEVRTTTQPSTSVKGGVSEQKVPKTSNSAKPISLQLDLISLSDQVANQLKEDIISKGLGATFNIQESVDSDITETISKGKQNSCK